MHACTSSASSSLSLSVSLSVSLSQPDLPIRTVRIRRDIVALLPLRTHTILYYTLLYTSTPVAFSPPYLRDVIQCLYPILLLHRAVLCLP